MLLALVFLGPPVVWLVGLAVREHIQRRRLTREAALRGRMKVSVGDIRTRVEQERAEQTNDLRDHARRIARQTGLPRGWVWPERDWDETWPAAGPPRTRLYVRSQQRLRTEETTDQLPEQ